jgi:hypothetical protein
MVVVSPVVLEKLGTVLLVYAVTLVLQDRFKILQAVLVAAIMNAVAVKYTPLIASVFALPQSRKKQTEFAMKPVVKGKFGTELPVYVHPVKMKIMVFVIHHAITISPGMVQVVLVTLHVKTEKFKIHQIVLVHVH